MPAADDLFRPTAGEAKEASERPRRVRAVAPVDAEDGTARTEKPAAGARRPSGRVRHDEKMTVYVTAEELMDLEHARLTLRRTHGVAVDRGRLVREAVALVLADLEANGADSSLVRRLTED